MCTKRTQPSSTSIELSPKIPIIAKRAPPSSTSISNPSNPKLSNGFIVKERIFKGPFVALVREHGVFNWSNIASFIPGQARERDKNHLDPALKKGAAWTSQEDSMLLSTMEAVGSKWAFISKKLPGRSDNGVKNRYNSILRSAKKSSSGTIIPLPMKKNKASKKRTLAKSKYESKFRAPTFVPLNLRWCEENPPTPPTMLNIYEKFKSSCSKHSS